jgi:hypothetical protein
MVKEYKNHKNKLHYQRHNGGFLVESKATLKTDWHK